VSSPTPLIALATGRIAVGATVFARPTLLAKGMGVDSATAERTAWVARMFAARDLALGLGLLWTLNRSQRGRVAELLGGTDPALREMLLLGVLSDLGDAVAVAGALRSRSVRALPAGATLVTALGAAAFGARAATS
jgi:hypothetical protein